MQTLHYDPVSGLSYRLRPGTGAHPLCLVMLHGVGASEAGFIDLAGRVDPRVTVVLARGPLTFGPQQFGWFRVSFTASGPQIDPAQAEQARLALLTFIRYSPHLHGVDPARIWLAGFSQGGIMSASVALTQSGTVAGFGILSGRILPEVLPLITVTPALPAFIGHGVHDQTLGIHFARQSRQLLDGFGLPLTYREYDEGHALGSAMAADFLHWLDRQLALTL